MIASAKDAHRLLRLRRFNLIACCIGAAVIGRIAAGPSWAGTLFALWSAMPLLIGVPAALTASKSSQQWAIAGVTALSFGAGLLVVHELSRSVGALTGRLGTARIPPRRHAIPADHRVDRNYLAQMAQRH